MQVKFTIDREWDEALVYGMLHTDDPSGAENRAEFMGLSHDEFSPIYHAEKYADVEMHIHRLSDKRYEEHKDLLAQRQQEYQAAWDEIGQVFSDEIERITGVSWKHPEYTVVCSLFHPGVSSQDEPKVTRWIFEDPHSQLRITAHEILMIHMWEYFASHYNREEVTEDRSEFFWALNELTTCAILGLEPSLNALWTSDQQGYDNFMSNYPQLKELKQIVKERYKPGKPLDQFLGEMMTLKAEKFKDTNFGFEGS